MKLFKNNKEKKQNSKTQTSSYENGNSAPLKKSNEEIYKEKSQQLKYWQTTFENEKQMHEQRTFQHNAYVEGINKELAQISEQMQAVRVKAKKRMIVFGIFFVILTVAVGGATYMLRDYHSQELAKYQQQLETELSEYTSEIEVQKQDLQQQIETLTQQLDSLQ
ncbi:MAG: hypothetical protein NC433_08580 [Clostridiales bacterium]|nr:hypothetical protein [Clostridiales bacterium]